MLCVLWAAGHTLGPGMGFTWADGRMGLRAPPLAAPSMEFMTKQKRGEEGRKVEGGSCPIFQENRFVQVRNSNVRLRKAALG